MGDWEGFTYYSGLDLSHKTDSSSWTVSFPTLESSLFNPSYLSNPEVTIDTSSLSMWRWLTPQYHDKKVIKKKQRREIEEKKEEWGKNIMGGLSASLINEVRPMERPRGILYYSDFPTITGNNYKP